MNGLNSEEICVAVIGAEGVGKSALTVRFLTKRFIGEYESSTDSVFRRQVFIANNPITLEVRDTVKTDWFEDKAKLIDWASAIVVVYSVTDRDSFLTAEKMLHRIHALKPLEPGCTLLLGNKDDLSHLRNISFKEGKRLAMHYGVRFHEVSASDNYDEVYSAFMKLLVEAVIVQKAKESSRHSMSTLHSPDILPKHIQNHRISEDSSPQTKRNLLKAAMRERLNSVIGSSLKQRTMTM